MPAPQPLDQYCMNDNSYSVLFNPLSIVARTRSTDDSMKPPRWTEPSKDFKTSLMGARDGSTKARNWLYYISLSEGIYPDMTEQYLKGAKDQLEHSLAKVNELLALPEVMEAKERVIDRLQAKVDEKWATTEEKVVLAQLLGTWVDPRNLVGGITAGGMIIKP